MSQGDPAFDTGAETRVEVPPRADVEQSPVERLLFEVLAVDGVEVEAVLAACPVPAHRDEVRRLLSRERDAARLLEAPQLSAETPPNPSPPVLDPGPRPPAALFFGSPDRVRRRLLRFARVMRLPLLLFFGLIVVFHAHSLPSLEPKLLGELGSILTIVLVTWIFEWTSRSPRLGDTAAVAVGILYGIVTAGLLAYFHAAHEIHRYGVVTGFGPHIVWISLVPMVLSVRAVALLAVVFVAALSSFGGFAAAAAVYGVSTMDLVNLEAAGALLAAVVGSLLIHRVLATVGSEVAAGLRFGSYRLEEKLGEGGMGEVWRARHPLLARPAAVKVMRPDPVDRDPGRHEELLERFLREARTTAALESPHTVRVFDYGVLEDGEAFLAMECLDGIDLRVLIRDHGPQPVDRVRSILLQICDSLDEAHGKGLIHRDLKPANLMLCRADRRLDRIKVLDFGVVQVDLPSVLGATSPQGLTRPGSLLGTPGYLAPEILEGAASASPRSDLYSLACVAYGLLTGRPVFPPGSPMVQMTAHLRDAPSPPSEHRPSLDASWDALLLACLAKRPAERPASVAELVERIGWIEPAGDWTAVQRNAWWAER